MQILTRSALMPSEITDICFLSLSAQLKTERSYIQLQQLSHLYSIYT